MEGVELDACVEVAGESIDDAGAEVGFGPTCDYRREDGERNKESQQRASDPKEPAVTASE